MKLIVDSNILFSALLNTDSLIGDILLNSQASFEFISCDYLKIELDKHKTKIIGLSHYSKQEYRELELIVLEQISFVSEALIPFEHWKSAADLVREVDMDDIAFVALSLFTGAPLWTRDKKLYDELRKKGFDKVLSTKEVQTKRTEGGDK